MHNIPAYGTEEVADSVLSHILNLYRSTYRLAAAVDRGDIIKGPGTWGRGRNEGGGQGRREYSWN